VERRAGALLSRAALGADFVIIIIKIIIILIIIFSFRFNFFDRGILPGIFPLSMVERGRGEVRWGKGQRTLKGPLVILLKNAKARPHA
jgi:hypothetical protein